MRAATVELGTGASESLPFKWWLQMVDYCERPSTPMSMQSGGSNGASNTAIRMGSPFHMAKVRRNKILFFIN